jgi:hypothetical protein
MKDRTGTDHLDPGVTEGSADARIDDPAKGFSMKRLSAIALGAGLVLAVGCGTQNYDFRLERTLDHMAYEKKLNDSLNDAPTKGKLEELQIYVRPPKDMTGPTQTFQMTVVEPGKFDVESSFIEQDKQSLHLLARVKRPKTPSKKAPTPAETTPRGDFSTDVLDLVKNVYGVGDEVLHLKEEKMQRGNNTFKTTDKTLDLNAKNVQIYLYGSKTSPYEVALIFEYPKAEHASIYPKIKLCLESFAVGDKARRAFAGGETEIDTEGGGEGPTDESAPPPI